MGVEWVLVAVMLQLGPYPVALRSYPNRAACVHAAQTTMQLSRAQADCAPVTIPSTMKAN